MTVQARSLHDLRPDAFSYVWDNSFAPALEIESGEAVQLTCATPPTSRSTPTPASTTSGSTSPMSTRSAGPIFVKGAKPGDVLAVELLEFSRDLGLDGDHPRLRPPGRRVPRPWLRISNVDADTGRVRFSDRITAPLPAVPGHDRRGAGRGRGAPGAAAVTLRREHRHQAPDSRRDASFCRWRRGRAVLAGDTHAAQGDGEVCGTAIETAMDVVVRLSVRNDLLDRRAAIPPSGRARARHEQSTHHVCTGVGPDLLEAAREAVRTTIGFLGDALRARPRGGLRPRERRGRPPDPRGRRRTELGGWMFRARLDLRQGS